MTLRRDVMTFPRQQGSVLVIGMILLVILMVGAVSMMNSSVQDERITGNTRRGADAFLAAEGGMQKTVAMLCTEYGGDKHLCESGDENTAADPAINPPTWYYYNECSSDGELQNVDEALYVLPANEGFSGGSTYTVTYGGLCTTYEGGGVKTISFVSTGQQANSLRRVHFNVSHDGEATWPAVFVNDDPDADPVECSFDFGPSNAYTYDGRGGPALSTNTPECAEAIREADLDGGVPSGRLIGGVVANNPAPDFTNPETGLKEFYKGILASGSTTSIYPEAPSNNNQIGKPVDFNESRFNTVDFGTPGDPSNPADYANMKSFVVHGDITMPGGFDGAGVLIVTGDATFSGTPNWDGLIIVLGGTVNIGGGGTTDGLAGTLIVSNIDFNDSATDDFRYCTTDGACVDADDADLPLDKNSTYHAKTPRTDTTWSHAGDPEINWDVSGGGSALYNYGCQYLMQVQNFVENISDTSFPGPEGCPDANGDGQTGSFGTLYVFDWYEEVTN